MLRLSEPGNRMPGPDYEDVIIHIFVISPLCSVTMEGMARTADDLHG